MKNIGKKSIQKERRKETILSNYFFALQNATVSEK